MASPAARELSTLGTGLISGEVGSVGHKCHYLEGDHFQYIYPESLAMEDVQDVLAFMIIIVALWVVSSNADLHVQPSSTT